MKTLCLAIALLLCSCGPKEPEPPQVRRCFTLYMADGRTKTESFMLPEGVQPYISTSEGSYWMSTDMFTTIKVGVIDFEEITCEATP